MMLEIILLILICSVENVKIGADNSLMTITNAQAKNQGTYRCVASNLFGMTHSIASLIVRGKPVQKQSLIIFHLCTPFLVSVFLDIYVQIFLLLHLFLYF